MTAGSPPARGPATPLALASLRLALRAPCGALADAAIAGGPALASALGARLPRPWPPASAAAALTAQSRALRRTRAANGWGLWYWLLRRPGGAAQPPLVVGVGGFHGPPGAGREVEIGYALHSDFEGRGYATEAVGLLTRWALAQPGVARIVARVERRATSSLAVLRRAGFVGLGMPPAGPILLERRAATQRTPGANTRSP